MTDPIITAASAFVHSPSSASLAGVPEFETLKAAVLHAEMPLPAPVSVVQAMPPIPGSYADLYRYYGDPRQPGFAAKHIVTVSHEVGGKQTPMQVHSVIAPILHLIWADMNAAGLTSLLKTFDGSFVIRNIIGGSNPSLHSWGLAADYGAAEYPLGSLKRYPQPLIDIWNRHGFVNGADFNGRKDPQHFQYTRPHTI